MSQSVRSPPVAMASLRTHFDLLTLDQLTMASLIQIAENSLGMDTLQR